MEFTEKFILCQRSGGYENWNGDYRTFVTPWSFWYDVAMSQYEKHVFVCISGPYCWYDGDTELVFGRLKRRVANAGMKDRVRINRSGCLNHCGHGPIVVVYPEGVWYGNVQADDVDEIFEEHLCQNHPVERLQLNLPPGNNKRTGHYPRPVHSAKEVEKELDTRRSNAHLEIKHAIAESDTLLDDGLQT